MESISWERRNELMAGAREVLKLELRDTYAVDAEDLAAWHRGDVDLLSTSYQGWADEVARQVAAGKTLRRVRVISEPLSDYQRMALRFYAPAVDAGDDIRWLPRRLTSGLPLPGNDFFVLDGEIAMFNVLDGDDGPAEVQYSRDLDVVTMCADRFESAWRLAIPYHDYAARHDLTPPAA